MSEGANLPRNQSGSAKSCSDISSVAPPARSLPEDRGNEPTSRRQVMSIANTNHEIRTPLQAIVGMTDLLFETPLTEKQKSYLQSIRSSSDVLLRIIDDVLAFSALEAGEARIRKGVVDIEEVIEPVLLMLGQQAFSKGVELVCDVPPQCLAIGDPDRLKQVLTNLVGNAVKFTDRGEVIVEASEIKDAAGSFSIELAIKDTGIGIDVDRKHEMFRPFSRVGSAAAHSYGGTGLGLAICKRLIEAMDGTIDIDARPGGGTVARLRMPAAKEPPQQPAQREDRASATKALVVDDNPRAGQAILRALGARAIRSELVTNGNSALRRLLECADNDPFRIVIIDADMSDPDGIATAREIRSVPSIRRTPLLILTSLGKLLPPGVASKLEARCLDKPVLPRLLESAVSSLLSGSRQATDNRDAEPTLKAAAGARLLVADDNAISRQIFAEMATVLGFTVDIAADGISAREELARNHYEVVLLDCQLPDVDGCKLATDIRSNPATANHPVIIAVTASASAEDRDRCLRAGMDDYLPKPVSLQQMRMTLEKWQRQRPPEEDLPESTAETGVTEVASYRRISDYGAASPYLIDLFAEDTEQRLSALARILGQDGCEPDRIAREAHALKSGCLFVKATGLAALASELERSARESAIDQAHVTLGRLRDEFDRFLQQRDDARSTA